MKRRRRDHDVFDAHGLLRNGATYHARMTLMDSTPANLFRHRPGFAVADSTRNDARRQGAYDGYHDQLINAWRGDAKAEEEEGGERLCPDCDGSGEVDSEECAAWGGIHLVPEEEAFNNTQNTETARRRSDHRTVAQQMRDHENAMARIYESYDRQLQGRTMSRYQPQTLEQRVGAALRPDATLTSADLAALIEEGGAAIAEADKEGAINQTLSLDPKGARQAIMDATLAANRLLTLLPKLQARYQEVYDEERAAAWQAEREATWLAEHDSLKPERDALAEELRDVYPLVTKIVDLFARIAANDAALFALHQARPAGVTQHLVSAELYARGLDNFTYNTPSLLTSVVLFDWDTGRQIWPPQRPSMASAFAATAMPGHDRRSTADWAKDNKRRAAGQQAEQQRIADYYERATKEQEDRQNAEASELFVAQQQRMVRRP